MAFHILDEIKKTPKSEWPKIAKDWFTRARIWIQENGEAAFVVGLASGFLLVAFYKVFIALLAIAVVAGCSLYLLSSEDDGVSSLSDTANGQVNSSPTSEKQEAGEEASAEETERSEERAGEISEGSSEEQGPTIH